MSLWLWFLLAFIAGFVTMWLATIDDKDTGFIIFESDEELECRYVNDRESRVLVWECPKCQRLWRESRLDKPKFKQHGVAENV